MTMNTTSDAERELIEAERLCAMTLGARDSALRLMNKAREIEAKRAVAYLNAVKRRDAAHRALRAAYQNEATQ